MKYFSLAILAAAVSAQEEFGDWGNPEKNGDQPNYRRFGLPSEGLGGNNVANVNPSRKNYEDIEGVRYRYDFSNAWWASDTVEARIAKAAKKKCHDEFVERHFDVNFDTHTNGAGGTISDSKTIVKCLAKLAGRDNQHLLKDQTVLGQECYVHSALTGDYSDLYPDQTLIQCLVDASRFADICPSELEDTPMVREFFDNKILQDEDLTNFYWCFFDRTKSIFRDQLTFPDDITAWDLASEAIGACLTANGLRRNEFNEPYNPFNKQEMKILRYMFKRNCRLEWQSEEYGNCQPGEYFDDLGECVVLEE